ncbi:hypothetical protein NKI56_36585, partial [Mesorhizobium sp. M0622]
PCQWYQRIVEVVFVPDELHLYVEFSQPDADTNPVDWMREMISLHGGRKAHSTSERATAWFRSSARR